MHYFCQDEGQLSLKETRVLQRIGASMLSAGGWTISERFDDRYDTMVGGFHTMVTQTIDETGQIQGGFEFDRLLRGEYPKEKRASYIVDFDDGGKHISAFDAENLPSLEPVLVRLRAREAEYEEYLAKRGV